MLKHSDEKVKTEFALLVINFINPKYNNPQIEIKPDIEKCKDFASKCELTKDEFMIALDMASRRLLTYKDGKREFSNPNYDGETVEYFREIDLSILGKIETAYIQFKQKDTKYEKGKKRISEYLNNQQIESEESKKERRLKLWEEIKKCVSENKPCVHAFLFYERLIKKGAFKNFVGNKEAQETVLKKKMQSIIRKEADKKFSVFNRNEMFHLKLFLTDKDYQLPETISFGLDTLTGMAIVEVKNDLVYNYVKKQLNKIINETEKSNQ